MKKLVLLISAIMMTSAILFAQNNCTLQIDSYDLSGMSAGEVINVPVRMVSVDDVVMGWEFYVLFDPAILTPTATFLQNQNPLFPGNWFENIVDGNQFAANWLDPTFSGVTVPADEVLFELQFTYNGGVAPGEMSEMTWNFESKKSENMQIKGVTAVVNGSFAFFDIIPIDGGVFMPIPASTWTGAVSSDWYTDGNWDNGVPIDVTNVTIPAGTPNDPQVIYDGLSIAVCNDIMIEFGALLIVGPDGYLTVLGTCTNEGFLGVISDADFNGSLICTSFAGAGEYNYWRYLGVNPQPDPDQQGWHYMSSPVQSFGSYNMFDYFVNTWDETTGNWVQNGSTTPCVPAPEIFMSGMEGWSVKFDENYAAQGCPNPGTGDIVEFIGDFNAGDQMSTLTYTASKGPFSGFNLVGNPYPSWWFYDGFYFGPNWPSGLNDAIYYWDESANQYASYVFGVGNNGGDPYVPPAQAFFFELDGSEPTVDLTFIPDEQAHVAGPYYKDDPVDLVQLQVNANGYMDQTSIKFNQDATINRDKMDARKLYSGGTEVPNLWTLANDIELSINQMPAADQVPVFFSCATSGTYNIEAVETSEFSILVLEDTFTGEETDLLTSNHTFDHISGSNNDRFVLHYKSTGIGDNELTNVSIWSGDQKIFVRTDVSARGDIVVFNMMGQEIIRTDIEPGLNTIPMNRVNTYYVVKVMTNEGVETGKVFIK